MNARNEQFDRIAEQYDATTVVYPDWQASVDELGNIVLKLKS